MKKKQSLDIQRDFQFALASFFTFFFTFFWNAGTKYGLDAILSILMFNFFRAKFANWSITTESQCFRYVV